MPFEELCGRYRNVRVLQYNVSGYKELNAVVHLTCDSEELIILLKRFAFERLLAVLLKLF